MKKSSRREFLQSSMAIGAAFSLKDLLKMFPEDKKPNILFLFSDDHAQQAISAYGSKINKTPNIDRIAKEGAIFENNFCGNAICAPSRATVLTGLHSHKNGVRDNSNSLEPGQVTFPQLLQRAGYETAMVGKWHLKNDPQGFDFWQVLPGQGNYYNPDFLTPQGKKHYEGYVTDITTDIALNWLEKQRDPSKPFLLNCWHKAPHRNWMPGPEHLTMYDDVDIPEPPTLFDDYSCRATGEKEQKMSIAGHMHMDYDLKVSDPLYNNPEPPWGLKRLNPEQAKAWDAAYVPKNKAFKAAKLEGKELTRWKYQRYIKDYLRCIASVDDNIGRMLDYLDESGLAENTLVIYSSDQGFYLGEHGWYDKRWMFEESLRMPLLMRWPGGIKPGTRIREITQNIDYAPTLVHLAGAKSPYGMQGKSMLALMQGKDVPWRKSIYYEYFEEPGPHNVPKHRGVRTERYKLIHYYTREEWELFDMETDPLEMNSVYGKKEYAHIEKQLKYELKKLMQEYDVPAWEGDKLHEYK